MMRTKLYRVFAAAVVGVLVGGCERELSRKTVAPDFQLSDLAGRSTTLAEFRGQVVLIGFWAVG